jgi:rubrerythrin
VIAPELGIKLMEQFKKEMDDVCKYRELEKMSMSDPYLKDALEEIEDDEYLHAKFLRKFLMGEGIFRPTEHIDLAQKWEHINS